MLALKLAHQKIGVLVNHKERKKRLAGAILGSYFREFEKKQKQDQKQLGIRFAHQLFLLATLGWES